MKFEDIIIVIIIKELTLEIAKKKCKIANEVMG